MATHTHVYVIEEPERRDRILRLLAVPVLREANGIVELAEAVPALDDLDALAEADADWTPREAIDRYIARWREALARTPKGDGTYALLGQARIAEAESLRENPALQPKPVAKLRLVKLGDKRTRKGPGCRRI